MTLSRNTGSGPVGRAVVDPVSGDRLALVEGKQYAIEGILTMDDDASTLDFKLNDGTTTALLYTDTSNKVASLPDNNVKLSYARFSIASGGGGIAAVDNITLTTAVPEPASLGLLCAGGLLMLRRRRR
jgi:hypothetical protein